MLIKSMEQTTHGLIHEEEEEDEVGEEEGEEDDEDADDDDKLKSISYRHMSNRITYTLLAHYNAISL
jgi:hypothetical protein